jgi:NAD(P) transhydrogenase subunit alpha
VVVDMAGESGGNCELTEPGQVVVKHDVTIASPLNLPASMPEHSSELYSRNVASLLELMLDGEGRLAPDYSDEVLAKSRVAGAPPADAGPAPGAEPGAAPSQSTGGEA